MAAGLNDLCDFLTLSVSVNSGAQLQFAVKSVTLCNLAMNPLELPPPMATGELLAIQLAVSADGGAPMQAAYLMSVGALGGVLGAVDPAQAAPASTPEPAASANGRPQPSLTPLPTGHQEPKDAVVRPVQFSSFASQSEGANMTNIDLILDVQLRVSVELGRKLMSVRDILALGPGSVVELDKVAGEPVDVLVNDRLIATGEVVVADDNFGVRITDIVNPAKRLSSR
ncbi:MAG: flagellar motor switch protein FliN [Chloroflexota bacterium]